MSRAEAAIGSHLAKVSRVASAYMDEGVVVTTVSDEIEALATSRETAIVLTAPWHERDAQSLVERLGAPVYTPLPDTAQYLMDTYGITAERAGDGSPDVVWLLREKRGEARPYSSGDRLPFGADVFPGHKANDTVLWVESRRAVISGDTLVDFGRGLEINESWLRPGGCPMRYPRRP